MKAFFIAFLALAVSASALPQEYEIENWEQRNLVERQIRQAIEALSAAIKDNGYDPLEVRRWAIETSPQPGIDMKVAIQDLSLKGASWIEIRRLDWSTLRSRLQLTVVLPEISFSLGKSRFEVNVQGQKYVSEFSGTYVLSGFSIGMDVTLNIGAISGISVRSLAAEMRFSGMKSDIDMVINQKDYSDPINNFMNDELPRWLLVNQRAIDSALSTALKWMADQLLG
ncbi:uncharacterized protein LOC123864398 [Maniola jurtina]|uniref:uncharacterized protein LOC123864398 n=1 Tax=Maniola jurtina TaxID=191418 RepID=UPI001E68A3CE|nr:uncharacterized protein LOC123864398 [Maniola jurtina]